VYSIYEFGLWKRCTLENWVFWCGEEVTLTPFSLLAYCNVSFPSVGLKMFSLPTFGFKSNIFTLYLTELINYVIWFLIKSALCFITYSVGACTVRTLMSHQLFLGITWLYSFNHWWVFYVWKCLSL